jgi:hypothetical protein
LKSLSKLQPVKMASGTPSSQTFGCVVFDLKLGGMLTPVLPRALYQILMLLEVHCMMTTAPPPLL